MPLNTTLVIVGTFTSSIYQYAVSPTGKIATMGSSTALGPNTECMMMAPDPTCNTEANLVTAANNCACDSPPGASDAKCCTADDYVVSSRISSTGAISVKSKFPSNSIGPIHMISHPSGKVAIANYVGGNAALYGPFDPTTGTLGSHMSASTALAERSLVHMVANDPTCDAAAKQRVLLAVDAGYSSLLIIDPSTGKAAYTVDFPARARRITFHPTLEIAYVIYETAKTFGVWKWPACEAWLTDKSVSPPVEISRVMTMPADAGGLNIPTSLRLTAKGDFAYTCTRTDFFKPGMERHNPNAATAKVGVFKVHSDGSMTNIQWAETPGFNTRECQLTQGDAVLLAVDAVSDFFMTFKRDAATGLLTAVDSKDVPRPTMIAQWVPGTMVCPSNLTIEGAFKSSYVATGAFGVAATGVIAVAIVLVRKRKAQAML